MSRPLDVRGYLEERNWVSDDEGNWKQDELTQGEWVEEDEAFEMQSRSEAALPPAE